MGEVANIQWFPGHMTKTQRLIEANLKMVDAVVEIVDARIPESSKNPILQNLIGNKTKIIVMNKCDYADENVSRSWKKHFEAQGYTVLLCDCRSGKGIKAFLPTLKNLLGELLAKRKDKGMIGKALRIMVVGIPNVGKSSFINRLAGSRRTKVEDRPGVTRGKQWVSLDKDVELLDMPGILWPKFDDQMVAQKLAYTGAIKDDVMDIEGLSFSLLNLLSETYPEKIKERFKQETLEGNILENIAITRGMLLSGGIPDTERASVAVLDEYRSGKIGKISLERPAD